MAIDVRSSTADVYSVYDCALCIYWMVLLEMLLVVRVHTHERCFSARAPYAICAPDVFAVERCVAGGLEVCFPLISFISFLSFPLCLLDVRVSLWWCVLPIACRERC